MRKKTTPKTRKPSRFKFKETKKNYRAFRKDIKRGARANLAKKKYEGKLAGHEANAVRRLVMMPVAAGKDIYRGIKKKVAK